MPLFPVAILFSSLSVKDTRVRCLCIENDKVYYTDISPYTENPVCKVMGTGTRSCFSVYGTAKLEVYLNNIRLTPEIYQCYDLDDNFRLIIGVNSFAYQHKSDNHYEIKAGTINPEIFGSISQNGYLDAFDFWYLDFCRYLQVKNKDAAIIELRTSLELTAVMYNPAVRYCLKISHDNNNWRGSNLIIPDNVLWFRMASRAFDVLPSTIQFPKQMMSVTAVAEKAICAPEICCSYKASSESGAAITIPKRMFSIPGSLANNCATGVLQIEAPLSDVLIDMSHYADLSSFNIHIRSCLGNFANLVLTTTHHGYISCETLPHTINVFNSETDFVYIRSITISGTFPPDPVINLVDISTELLYLTFFCKCDTPVIINISSACKIKKILYESPDKVRLRFPNSKGTMIARA